jgi:hypothetical protein
MSAPLALNGERVSVEIHPSNWLYFLLAGAHLVAALILAVTFGFGGVLAGGSLLLVLSAALWWPHIADSTGTSKFDLAADRGVRWHRDQHTIHGTLRRDTTALPGLIILRFDENDGGRVRSLVLLPGVLRGDDWRALQVFLRWGVRFDAAVPAP